LNSDIKPIGSLENSKLKVIDMLIRLRVGGHAVVQFPGFSTTIFVHPHQGEWDSAEVE